MVKIAETECGHVLTEERFELDKSPGSASDRLSVPESKFFDLHIEQRFKSSLGAARIVLRFLSLWVF